MWGLAATKFNAEYGRFPRVDEIRSKTGYSPNQIYATNAYNEYKILRRSAKLTNEMMGKSVAAGEQFGNKSIEHSRADRQSKSDQDQIDALIDQQNKDATSDHI